VGEEGFLKWPKIIRKKGGIGGIDSNEYKLSFKVWKYIPDGARRRDTPPNSSLTKYSSFYLGWGTNPARLCDFRDGMKRLGGLIAYFGWRKKKEKFLDWIWIGWRWNWRDGREWHPNVRKTDWRNFGMESDLGVESVATMG
jgi:hypothetical protein